MRYYLIAGEASGDLHGASLMKAIKQHDEDAQFRFFGGDLMQKEGGELVKHYADMAYMGFVEVVLNLKQILSNLRSCKKDILDWKPDLVILIDFPGFNMKVAAYVHELHIPVYYYISPKVWAWNQKRVLKIKKVVDRMFCILPFEVDFYKSWGMEVDYIGNPLLDAIKNYNFDPDFTTKQQLDDRPVITLLPGSRKQEISRILPDMIAAAEKFPEMQIVIAGAPTFSSQYYTQYMSGKDIPVIFNATYDLLKIAKAAVVTSGTATLETALFQVPQVVVYKGNPVSIGIARLLVKIKFISLVNLIMNKGIVKELIQEDCNEKAIAMELKNLIYDTAYREKVMSAYDLLNKKMGSAGASERAAALIMQYLKKENEPRSGTHLFTGR
jgi:lipid-A-disaccharide synthase